MGRRRKRRIWLPGEAGDEFIGEDIGGEAGQYVTLAHDFRYVMSAADLATGPYGFGVPDFLWPGSGGTPLIGPVLNVTDGAPTAGVTPWQDRAGAAIPCENFTTSDSRRTVTACDPGLTEDFIAAVVGRVGFTTVAGYYSTFFGTLQAGRGWRIAYRHDTNQMYCFLTGDAGVNVSVAANVITPNSWFVCVVTCNRSGLLRIFANNIAGSTVATPAGSYAGSGVGISGQPLGGGRLAAGGRISSAMAWYGAGEAALWEAGALHTHLTHRLQGIYPSQGGICTYTRASSASWQNRNNIWHIASNGLPRAGDSGGFRQGPARTNKAYRNINPQNTAALTWTGAKAPTVVDDSVALAAQGCEEWGPNAYEYVNDTGATQYIRMSAATGNLNAHSLQCLVRQLASSGTKLGLYDVSAGTFSGSAIHDGYDARTLIQGQVPTDTDQTLCLEVPNGVTIRWIAQDMSEVARCYNPIPNWATAAASTKALGSFTTSVAPDDAGGSFEMDVASRGWSANEAGTVVFLLRNLLTLIYVTAGTWRATLDGTTGLNGTTAPADGVSNKIRARWHAEQQSLTVDTDRQEAAYDGSLRGTGGLNTTYNAVVSLYRLIMYRNGDG